MTRYSFFSLRVRLLLLVLIAVLPVLGLTLYTAAEERRLAATRAQEEALRLVRLASSDQEHLIEGARQLLAVMAQLPEVRSGNSAASCLLFAQMMDHYPLYASIGMIKPDGDLFCSAPPASGSIIGSPKISIGLSLKLPAPRQ